MLFMGMEIGGKQIGLVQQIQRHMNSSSWHLHLSFLWRDVGVHPCTWISVATILRLEIGPGDS